MKLELKHLAPYLPYQVKCLVTNDGEEQIDILGALYDNGECTFYNIVEATQGFESIKPILRPLSDMDVDGGMNTPKYLQGCCYSYVQNLISQHFDIFGLIEKGLAIDINTIEPKL